MGGRVWRQRVSGYWRRAQSMQKARKTWGTGYGGRGGLATGAGLKVCKKRGNQGGPGMAAEGAWPLAQGSKYAKSEEIRGDRVWRQRVPGHWRRAQSMQKARKSGGTGYGGRGSLATGAWLKVCKKQGNQGGPGMAAEGPWPL